MTLAQFVAVMAFAAWCGACGVATALWMVSPRDKPTRLLVWIAGITIFVAVFFAVFFAAFGLVELYR